MRKTSIWEVIGKISVMAILLYGAFAGYRYIKDVQSPLEARGQVMHTMSFSKVFENFSSITINDGYLHNDLESTRSYGYLLIKNTGESTVNDIKIDLQRGSGCFIEKQNSEQSLNFNGGLVDLGSLNPNEYMKVFVTDKLAQIQGTTIHFDNRLQEVIFFDYYYRDFIVLNKNEVLLTSTSTLILIVLVVSLFVIRNKVTKSKEGIN